MSTVLLTELAGYWLVLFGPIVLLGALEYLPTRARTVFKGVAWVGLTMLLAVLLGGG